MFDMLQVLNKICRRDKTKGFTKGWQFMGKMKFEYGTEYKYRCPSGYSYVDVEKQVDALYASVGKPVEIIDLAGAVIIRVLAKELPLFLPLEMKYFVKDKIYMGLDQTFEPAYHNFNHPHMMIGAETGWGKTELIRSILYQLCYNYSPDEAEIVIVDMKTGLSFLPFRNLPHVVDIAYDLKTAHRVIKETRDMMMERGEEVRVYGKRSGLQDYKKRYVFIDEAASISPASFKQKDDKKVAGEIDNYLSEIVRIGREIGIYLFYCTQYPHSDVTNPQVKINCGARVSFYVPQLKQSEVILGEPGAEKLKVKGRAIFKSGDKKTIQVPYVKPEKGESDNDSAWEKLILPLKVGVINSGSSQRRDVQRNCVEGVIVGTHRDDTADRETVRLLPTQQESEQHTETTREGERGRMGTDRHEKNLAAHSKNAEVQGNPVSPNLQHESYADDF